MGRYRRRYAGRKTCTDGVRAPVRTVITLINFRKQLINFFNFILHTLRAKKHTWHDRTSFPPITPTSYARLRVGRSHTPVEKSDRKVKSTSRPYHGTRIVQPTTDVANRIRNRRVIVCNKLIRIVSTPDTSIIVRVRIYRNTWRHDIVWRVFSRHATPWFLGNRRDRGDHEDCIEKKKKWNKKIYCRLVWRVTRFTYYCRVWSTILKRVCVKNRLGIFRDAQIPLGPRFLCNRWRV